VRVFLSFKILIENYYILYSTEIEIYSIITSRGDASTRLSVSFYKFQSGPLSDFSLFSPGARSPFGNSKGGCAGRGATATRVDGGYGPDLAASVSSRVVFVWAPVSSDVCTVRWRARGAWHGVTGPILRISARGRGGEAEGVEGKNPKRNEWVGRQGNLENVRTIEIVRRRGIKHSRGPVAHKPPSPRTKDEVQRYPKWGGEPEKRKREKKNHRVGNSRPFCRQVGGRRVQLWLARVSVVAVVVE